MRKLIVHTWMTLDGVAQAPGAPEEDTTGGFQHGGWHLPYFDDTSRKWVADSYATAGGFLFGPVIGTIAALVGALAGGTVIFLIARSACGEWLTRRAGPFAAKLAEGFRADAFSYLMFLRLVPFPFWLINLAPALFNVRLSTFVAATAIGILPASLTFAVFGAGLDSVIAAQEGQYNACLAAGRADCKIDFDLSQVLTPTLLLALGAFALLALVPAFARRIIRRKLDIGIPPKPL